MKQGKQLTAKEAPKLDESDTTSFSSNSIEVFEEIGGGKRRMGPLWWGSDNESEGEFDAILSNSNNNLHASPSLLHDNFGNNYLISLSHKNR